MLTNVSNKKVLVRVDFNVPINSDHQITDDTRIQKALPTIKQLLDGNAAVILMSHLGRPQKKKLENGEIDVKKFSLKQVVPHLSTLLGIDVKFAADCGGDESILKARDLKVGEVLVIENTRFNPGESKGDSDFAAKLAHLGDAYINDAFGTAHRAHASTATIASFFEPQDRSFGLLMETEIANAKSILNSPKRPCTAIFGGAKVSDKIKLIERFINFADNIVIGGGMAYTFIKAQEGSIGNSLVEDDYLDLAKDLIAKAKEYDVNLIIPEDSVIADNFAADANTQTVLSSEIPDGWMGLDVGPKAIEKINAAILGAKSIIWNGPLGVFEMEAFSTGTMTVADTVAKASQNGAYSLIGGGDSVAAINKSGNADKVSFISTGGGAMLEFLEGKQLPGIVAIEGNQV